MLVLTQRLIADATCDETRRVVHRRLLTSQKLETRAQALQAKQFCTSGSAVKFLRDTGFLQIPGRGLHSSTSQLNMSRFLH